MRLRVEKRPVGIHIYGKVRMHSKRPLLPDSWDLSTSITMVGYLVWVFFSLLKFRVCWKDRKLDLERSCSLVLLNTDPFVKWSQVESNSPS